MRRTGPLATAVVALLSVLALAGCGASVAADSGAANAAHRTSASVAVAPAPPAPVAASTATPTPSVIAHTTPNPCRHNRHGQLVLVSLREQHLWICRATTIAHQTAITSGMVGQYTETPTGHYRIQALDRDQTLTLIDGQQYQVKYWIPFDAPLFGFHDASWQRFPFGSAKYRRHGSHGCVHMPTHAIATLYRWAHVGTRVAIH